LSVPDWRVGGGGASIEPEGVTEVAQAAWRGRFERIGFGPGFNLHLGVLEIARACEIPVLGADEGSSPISAYALVSGCARLRMSGWPEIELAPGKAILFRAADRRGLFRLPAPQTLRFFSVAMAPKLMVELVDGRIPAALKPLIRAGARTVVKERPVGRATRSLIDGLGAPGDGGALERLHREAVAIQLLTEMIAPDLRPDRQATALADAETAAVRAARGRLLADLRDPPPAAALAAAAGMGLRRFLRAFEAQHGASPAQLLRLERLNRARQLLETGEASLKQIAWQVGYGHVSNFVAAFSEHYGAPPRRFSRQGLAAE
jgi:AraC-like DNA-binding protein